MTRDELVHACFPTAWKAMLPGDFPLQVTVGADVVANVDVYWRTIHVGGLPVKAAGIGNVCTLEAARGQGLASALIRYAHLVAVRAGAEWAGLFADSPAFYSRFGYYSVPDARLSLPDFEPPFHFMLAPLVSGQFLMGVPIETGTPW